MGLKHVWIKLRDTLRFKWAKSKFDFTPSGAVDKFSFASCHHVVVLKLDGKLGDTQVMTHFYATLRAQSPRIMLSVVCSPNLASIYKDILGFDQVLVASRKPKAKEIIELCHKIKAATPVSAVGSIAGKIDLVVTTEPNFRPRDFIFNYELAPRYVAGCETKVDSVNLLIYDPYKRTKPVAECFVDLMDLGNLPHGKIVYQRLVTPESLAKMRKWLHLPEQLPDSIDLARAANEAEDDAISPREQRFLLAINPRASSRSRSFTDEFTVTLIQELQAQFGSANGLEASELGPESEGNAEGEAQASEAVDLPSAPALAPPKKANASRGVDQSHTASVSAASLDQSDTSTLVQSANSDALSETPRALASSHGDQELSGNSLQVAANKLPAEDAGANGQSFIRSQVVEQEDAAEPADAKVTNLKTSKDQVAESEAIEDAAQAAEEDAAAVMDRPLKISRDLEFVILTPPHADELKQKVKAAAVNCGASVFFLPEDSTVLDLSSSIDLCDALITVDTAAVHMACASHRPQLCVYTGTNLNESIRWAPLDSQAEVVRCEGQSIPEISETLLLQKAVSFVRRWISD